ncbi:MAG: oligosaccharide flippase family protein [Acidobacteria bacterium]|nr:oligosaccharide flippase family protein [Acidobacteriota bacterium]
MIRRSVVVGFFALLGGVSGIVVDTSIAARLGLSHDSDAFYVAFTVPYIVSNLLTATGQFSLVPFFAWLETHHSEEELWRGFSYVVNLVFLGMVGLGSAGILLAPWLVRVVAPGFTHDQTKLATELTGWLFLLIVPAGVAEVFRSFLLSRHHFALPSAAGLIRSLTVILFIILGYGRFGVYSVAYGFVAGNTVQLLALAGESLARYRIRYSWTILAEGEAFEKLHGAGTAQLGSAAAWQGVVILERVIASFLPPGTITALNFALKIMTSIVELLGGSVGTATLPALSRAVARADRQEERRTFQHTLEISLLLLTPAVVFCLLLNFHIIRMVFERGSFTRDATVLMAMVFFYYTLSLLPFSFIRLMTFYLFARNEPRVFLKFSIFAYGLTVVFDLIFVGLLEMGAKGIPLGMLAGFSITSIMIVQRNAGEIRRVLDRSLGSFAARNLAGGALAAAAVWVLGGWLRPPLNPSQDFIYLSIVCSTGSVVYLASISILGGISIHRLEEMWPREDASD